MSSQITVRIDGLLCTASEGDTIFEVAKANGKTIPSLCHMAGVSAAGSCRLCLVEVAGIERLLPACTTPAQRGMAVTTTSERLNRHRRLVLELLFVERNHICAVCVANGHCELQALAVSLGVTHVRYPYNAPRLPVDMSHPRFVLDHNRCVLCSRCVRVCDEIEGAHVWDIGGRGIGSRIVAEFDKPWGESDACTSCGKCVQVCPTGALVTKGYAVEEMTRSNAAVTRLASMKGGAA
jgi:bidirectional [NiFe] hydrogenase diaphorase subunit